MSKETDKIFLTSDRLYLRPLERQDLKGPYRKWINDPEITRYMMAGTYPVTDDQMESYYDAHVKSKNAMLFAIVEKETNRHIGNARIYLIDWVNRTVSRGIMIGDKKAWGKGYGLEVINLLSEYSFMKLNLNKLKAGAIAGNAAIRRVNEKAGYKMEGVHRQEFFRDNTYHDYEYWGLTKEDYLAKKNDTK